MFSYDYGNALFYLNLLLSGHLLAERDQRLVEHEVDRRTKDVRPHLRSQCLGKFGRFLNNYFLDSFH